MLLAVGLFFLGRDWRSGRELGADLDRRLEAASRERTSASTEIERLDRLARESARNRLDTARLYEERFSTEKGRFTDLVREIKRLAEHAGLDPKDIGYPEESLEGFGLSRRSFIFAVDGSYANLRAFLHLLELSPSFVTLNEIAVSERDGGKGLSVSLRLTTFFAEGRAPATAPPTVGGAS